MGERTNRETVAGLLYALPPLEQRQIPMLGDGAGGPRFVAASDLEMLVLVEKRSWVAEVGGVRVGVGAVHGRVLTLLRIGPDAPAPALLCQTDSGEAFLIEGGKVDKVDRFIADGEACITWEGVRVERLDVTALYRFLEKHLWERSALVGARVFTKDDGIAKEEGEVRR